MDDKTKDLIMRALKEGVEVFSLDFLEKRGINYEYVGSSDYETKKRIIYQNLIIYSQSVHNEHFLSNNNYNTFTLEDGRNSAIYY